jgi:hypothetical protein
MAFQSGGGCKILGAVRAGKKKEAAGECQRPKSREETPMKGTARQIVLHCGM